MKIVHLAYNLTGGAGIGLQRYHDALCAAGVDSRVLLASGPEPTNDRVARASRQSAGWGARVARWMGRPATPAERLLAELNRLDQAASGRPGFEIFSPPFSDWDPETHPWVTESDIVNLHWVAGLVDWPRFLGRVRQPLMITLHDQQPYLGGFHYERDLNLNPHLARLEARVRRTKQQALASHRVAVVGNSRWNTAAARASDFFPAETSFDTVLYPLEPTRYPLIDRAAARAVFQLDPARHVIGFACENLQNQRKGMAVLLDALDRLPAEVTSRLTLLTFGNSPDRTWDHHLNIPVIHAGTVPPGPLQSAIYRAMDVMVVPSLAEAFGQTAAEAMLCGTPVIASAVDGLPEAVAGDPDATLVPAGNATALAEALARVRTPTMTAAERRQLVAERHDPTVAAEHYLQAAEALLARKGSASQ